MTDPMPRYDRDAYQPRDTLTIEHRSDLPEWDGTDDEARQLAEDSRAAETWPGWVAALLGIFGIVVR
jgi:hypothetical protein